MPIILSIAQYERAGAADGDEHWCLAALDLTSQTGRAFEIVGGTYDYAYSIRDFQISIKQHDPTCGGCTVGELQDGGLDWLGTRLSEVSVFHGDQNWNCRNWVIDAVRELQLDQREHPDDTKVRINPDFSRRAVLAELKEERERCEFGMDHYFERLLQVK